MVLSRRLHAVQPQIIVTGCHVAQATCLKYLGVAVSSNLSWSANIHNTCANARKQLGLLYQHFHCSAPAGLLCLCVGPPPHYLCQLTQGYTAKLATGSGSQAVRTPSKLWTGLLLLVACRKRQKLLLCKHILFGGSIIPPSVFTPHPHPSSTLHQCMALYRPITKTSVHLHSFPSVVTLWNNLSSDLISAHSQAMLKHHLNQVIISTLSTIPTLCTLNSGIFTFLVVTLILHLSSPFACSLLSSLLFSECLYH